MSATIRAVEKPNDVTGYYLVITPHGQTEDLDDLLPADGRWYPVFNQPNLNTRLVWRNGGLALQFDCDVTMRHDNIMVFCRAYDDPYDTLIPIKAGYAYPIWDV